MRISRGSFRAKTIFSTVSILLLGILLAVSLPAFPAQAAGLVRGPYVQNVTVDSALICLETDVAVVATVRYGMTPDYGSTAQSAGAQARQCVELADILPYTQYHYQVFVGGVEASSAAAFRTLAGSDQRSISFAAWGDNRTNFDVHRQLALSMRESNPDLVLNTGDLVDSGSRLSDWSLFFQAERELLVSAPVYPAIGNHEGNDPLYFSLFHLPGNERWYSFDSGPVHFVALDSVFSSYAPGSEQYRWLEQDLSQTTSPWKVVVTHFPPYSFSAIRPPNQQLRNALAPIFEKYGVQLVFSGHDHYYQRNVVNDVTYVVTGGGGAPLYPLSRGSVTAYAELTYHFVKILVDGDTLTSTGVRRDGTEFDSFTLRTDFPFDEVPIDATPSDEPSQVGVPDDANPLDETASSSPPAVPADDGRATLVERLPFRTSSSDEIRSVAQSASGVSNSQADGRSENPALFVAAGGVFLALMGIAIAAVRAGTVQKIAEK